MVSINCEAGQSYHQFKCDTVYPDYIGGRGVTYWGFPVSGTVPAGYNVTIGAGQTETFSFTCTTPECFSDIDAVLAYFNAYINSNENPPPDSVRVWLSLNTVNNWGAFDVSGVYQHGAQQAIDFAFVGGNAYHAGGRNTFKMTNVSDYPVCIEDFKIMRVYTMCNLQNECDGECDDEEGADCPPMDSLSPTGNLDSDNYPYVGRRDFPCNTIDDGQISFTFYKNEDYAIYTIPAGDTVQFTFDWSGSILTGNNYDGGSVCLFNFNKMITQSASSYDDVTLTAYINSEGTPFATYHFNAAPYMELFPSYDLMQLGAYDDAGANTIKLVNNSDVDIEMHDGYAINIYRTYNTRSVACYCSCQDCQTACELACQDCQTACELACQDCQTGCEVSCQDCQACETCETCVSCQTSETCPIVYYTCETCETCQPCYSCYVACQETCQISCQTGCEVACQDCQTTCEVSCQACEVCVTCQTSQTCPIVYYTCQGCETCQPCYSCQTACELSCQTCQTTCELVCQTGCQVSCQTACELSCQTCQTACDTACQDCQICVTCQTSETCPIVYYTCQGCETCQPGYT